MRKSSCVSTYACALIALALIAVPGLASAADIYVAPGGDLQAALNAAQGGDTVLLAPGATYTGNFKLPVHTGTGYVTVRTAADASVMPPGGTRVSPAYATYLAKLHSPTNAPALRTAPGAAYWQLLFVEIAPSENPAGDLVDLGDGSSGQFDLSQVPHDLILDRVYVHGDRLAGQKRGIGLNSASTTIVNSYFADLKAVGADAQAIAGWNGTGPYRIENNYIEGAGTTVLFGGDDPKIPGVTPSDITFRGNTVTRPVSWRDPILAAPAGAQALGTAGGSLAAGTYGYRIVARRAIGSTIVKSAPSAEVTTTVAAGSRVNVQWAAVPDAAEYLVYGRTAGGENHYWRVTTTTFSDDGTSVGTAGTASSAGTVWQVKNLFELKNARHVQADFNLLEHNWAQAQAGTAILFTPRNQYGSCTWCTVEDVTFEYNIVRSIAGGIQVLGWDNLHQSQQANAIRIRNNEVYDLSKSWGSNAYFLYITGGPRDVTVDHNTIISPNGSGVLIADGAPVANFVFTNNLARHNSYGIFGSGYAIGNATIAHYFPDSVITRNVLAGGKASAYPAGNEFPTTSDFEAHFVNYAESDFALVPSTGWHGTGTDGLDLGADIEKILASRTDTNPPQVATTTLPDATSTVAYSSTLTATGGVAPYQWLLADGALPAGVTMQPTGEVAGTPTVRGDYSFLAQVSDAAGTTATQALVLHVAKAPNVLPVVSMTAPADGAVVPVGASVTLSASGLDVDGTVARIDLYQGDTLIGSAPGDSIALSWNPPASGTFLITAVAVDNDGGTARSVAITITGRSEIVLYAADATRLSGNYQLTADATATGGTSLWNPDQAAAKIITAAAAPASYAEFTFYAEAGRPYHLWIRGKGQRNNWANDSAFIQFSAVAGARIDTTGSLTYSLETALNAGIDGWGWEDNGWGTGVLGANVVFETTGMQTLRIQPREDGLAIDQIVLSPEKYLTSSPGILKNDATILGQ
jgi:hypothetical protein